MSSAELNTNEQTNNSHEARLFKIADQMLLNGEKVTIRSILDKFPDINSTSTLSNAYTKWRKKQKELANSIENRLSFSLSFNTAIATELSRLLDVEKLLLEEEQSDLQDQVNILHREIQLKSDAFEEAVAEINKYKDEVATLRAEIGVHLQSIQSAQESHQSDLEDQKAHFEGLITERDQTISKHEIKIDTLTEENSKNASEAAKNKVLLEEAEKKLTVSHGQIDRLTKQVDGIPNLRADLSVQKALRESKEAEIKQLQKRYDELQEKSSRQASQLEVNSSKLEDFNNMSQSLVQQSARLEDALSQVSALTASERSLSLELRDSSAALLRLGNVEKEANELRGQLSATREQLTTSLNQVTALSQQIGQQSLLPNVSDEQSDES